MVLASTVLKVEGPYHVHDLTISDAYNVSGGSLMVLSGARTAVPSLNVAGQSALIFAGIADSDKEAGNGKLNIGCAQGGIYKLTNGGTNTIAAGDLVVLSGANTISGAGATAWTVYTAGRCLQSIAKDATGEIAIMGALR